MIIVDFITKLGYLILSPFEKGKPFVLTILIKLRQKFAQFRISVNRLFVVTQIRFHRVAKKVHRNTRSLAVKAKSIKIKLPEVKKLSGFIALITNLKKSFSKKKEQLGKKKLAKRQMKQDRVAKKTELEHQLAVLKAKKAQVEYPNKLVRVLHVFLLFVRSALNFLLIYLLGFVTALFFVLLPYQIWLWWKELPSPDLLVTDAYSKTTKIYDRNDRLLYEIYVDKNYNPVKLDKVPQVLIDATIAVEDAQFYNHVGVRPESIARAAFKIIKKEEMQGGSTITQQLIKNVLLTPERTIQRKIKEVVLALLVESKYTKQEILELYLNNISYGGEAWGIQSAAKKYFDKDVWEVSQAEATMLAGLPSAPSTYSPLTDPDLAKERQKYVLARMVETGYLSQSEADNIYGEKLIYRADVQYIRAPHFVDFVRKDLEQKYGKRFVDLGGLTVKTTLDIDLQDKVQKSVSDGVAASQNLGITNGAAVVLRPENAEILAYVGSVDYFRDSWGAYDVASAYRQPGSSIKPVTYALALANGYTPSSAIKDSPVTFQVTGSKPYTPVNYDGKFHGDVTLRAALANSYNIPAVRLAHALGSDNVVALGKQMGLTNWQVDGSYGLSVTLGGKEVRLVDLTNVYATFARGGKYQELSPYLSIKDGKGFEIYSDAVYAKQQVITPEVSYLIWHILSDNIARIPAFGTQNSLVFNGRTVAVKTGTTDLKRDNWTLGFTPNYTVGVWVGNNDNTPMKQYLASGLSGAAPIWHDIVQLVAEQSPDEVMQMPEGVFVKIYKDCGNKSEVFIKGSTLPKTLCPKKSDKDKEEKKDKNN